MRYGEIHNSRSKSQILIDPFVGSDMTVIAVEVPDQRAYALELDPIYRDTVIRRWEAYTAKPAVHVEAGYIVNLSIRRHGP